MRRNREQVNAVFLHVHGNLADGLHGISVEEHAFFVAELADFCDRLNHANFIIGKHDADQDGLVVDRPLEVFQVDQAIGLYRQIGYAVAILLQSLAGVEDGFVLGYLGNDVIAALAIHLRNALDGEVVTFRRAGGKNDLLGSRAD